MQDGPFLSQLSVGSLTVGCTSESCSSAHKHYLLILITSGTCQTKVNHVLCTYLTRPVMAMPVQPRDDGDEKQGLWNRQLQYSCKRTMKCPGQQVQLEGNLQMTAVHQLLFFWCWICIPTNQQGNILKIRVSLFSCNTKQHSVKK